MTASGRVASSLALLGVGLAYLGASPRLSSAAREVPLLVLVPTLALLAAQVVFDRYPTATAELRRHLRGLALHPLPPGRHNTQEAAGRGRAALLALAFPAAILLLGLRWGPAVVTLVWLRATGTAGWGKAVAAAALVALVWLLFEMGLGVAGFGGALGRVL